MSDQPAEQPGMDADDDDAGAAAERGDPTAVPVLDLTRTGSEDALMQAAVERYRQEHAAREAQAAQERVLRETIVATIRDAAEGLRVPLGIAPEEQIAVGAVVLWTTNLVTGQSQPRVAFASPLHGQPVTFPAAHALLRRAEEGLRAAADQAALGDPLAGR